MCTREVKMVVDKINQTFEDKTYRDGNSDAQNGIIKKDSSGIKDREENGGSEKDTTETKDKEVNFDDLLSYAGEFGLYQFLLCLSTCPFYFCLVLVYYSQLFMTEASPNHWCWIPELENLTDIERRNLAIPVDEHTKYGYSQCTAYKANWTEVITSGLKPNHDWPIEKCQNGWEFDKSEIPYPTITSEMEWVCDKESYQATAQTIFFVGSIVGGLIIGWTSDRFGRLPAIVISNSFGLVGGVASIFARNIIEFSIYRFITGMAYNSCTMVMYVLVLEYVAPKYRSVMANLSFAVFYTIAAIMIPWVALYCGHWKTFGLVSSVPLVFGLFAPFFVPESAKWLLSKRRVDESVNKLLNISRINNKQIPSKAIEQFKLSSANMKTEEKDSMISFLTRPLLRKTFILICIEYICCALVFDGLIRGLGQLEFNFFMSFTLVSCTEFPSQIILAFILDITGRRCLVSFMLFVTSVFCFLTAFLNDFVSVIFAVLARSSMNFAYGATIQWAPETLPVSVRGSASSVIYIFGFIGCMLSPYIVYLKTFYHWLPMVILGCICILGGVIAFFLPETANKVMPQTYEAAEEMSRGQKCWDLPCLRKRQRTYSK